MRIGKYEIRITKSDEERLVSRTYLWKLLADLVEAAQPTEIGGERYWVALIAAEKALESIYIESL